jgi:gluconate 2-dehydrogenase gamma chain
MSPIDTSPSRRSFLKHALATPLAVVTARGASAAEAYKPTYFNADEWRVLTQLVDRLIPADETGPGALEAGVPEFIDRQMEAPYGHGALWYLEGPFHDAGPEFGYQLSFTPRELYRAALPALGRVVRAQQGREFSELDDATKDEVILRMERGAFDLGVMPSRAFFDQLLQNTREGFFCDPVHGGNKDMASWRMINFPGARADYIDWVEQYGRTYPFPPVSLGPTKG